jgi:hypothetical protein
VRAYSHQGQGSRAEQQAGYITATFRYPNPIRCETQPVHTLGQNAKALQRVYAGRFATDNRHRSAPLASQKRARHGHRLIARLHHPISQSHTPNSHGPSCTFARRAVKPGVPVDHLTSLGYLYGRIGLEAGLLYRWLTFSSSESTFFARTSADAVRFSCRWSSDEVPGSALNAAPVGRSVSWSQPRRRRSPQY